MENKAIKISWFEFLLQESLLKEHLLNPKPDPSATELIALFLYQADVALAIARDIKDDTVLQPNAETQKVRGLKLLALKVAANLQWDLDVLNNSVPLAMVQDILLELLKLTLEGDADPARHCLLDLEKLPPYALFAIQLYHRWCLKVYMEDCFPSRPSKSPCVQVPGLEIPVLNASNGKDTVMQILREGLSGSLMVLHALVNQAPATSCITLESLSVRLGDDGSSTFSWDQCIETDSQALVCQVAYDLGCLLFFQQKFHEAFALFKKVDEIIQRLAPSPLCKVNDSQLSGYLQACRGVLNIHDGDMHPEEKLFCAKRNKDFKTMIQILVTDNYKKDLSWSSRQQAEEELLELSDKSVWAQVCVINGVYKLLQGELMPCAAEQLVRQQSISTDLYFSCLESHLDKTREEEKEVLKSNIKYICQRLEANTSWIRRVLNGPLVKLFTSVEKEELKALLTLDSSNAIPLDPVDLSTTDLSCLEHQLIQSIDPQQIKSLSQRLVSKVPKEYFAVISEKWPVHSDVKGLTSTVPIPWAQVHCQVLLGKANTYIQLEHYDDARTMLLAVESTLKDTGGHKLLKNLRWHLLRVDLMQHCAKGQLGQGISEFDLKKRAKNYLSPGKDQEVAANSDIAMYAVAFLYNTHEWSWLRPQNTDCSFLKLIQPLSALCEELPMISTSRTAAKDLWELVHPIFIDKSFKSDKIDKNGKPEKNEPLTPAMIVNFVKLLKDQVTMSAVLSCLIKLYCYTNTDLATTEINLDYSSLWPSTILTNTKAYMVSSLSESLQRILEHALTLNPFQLSWLRSIADLSCVNCHYKDAIRQYLKLGIIGTEYFNDPITKNVYDDQIYRRMIKCFQMLQCHTQVVVLCQFLDEVDYSLAFKALQETTATDALDSYYEYIWDIILLEYIVDFHNRRGEYGRRQMALKMIGQPEVNSSNPSEILYEVAKKRKAAFFRNLVNQYF